jgi:hypothetical protein
MAIVKNLSNNEESQHSAPVELNPESLQPESASLDDFINSLDEDEEGGTCDIDHCENCGS